MNERKGEVFSIAAENAPVDGCTVSKAVAEVARRVRFPTGRELPQGAVTGVESPISPFQPERTSAPKHTTTINSG